jgi:predicted nucleotidyltransferase
MIRCGESCPQRAKVEVASFLEAFGRWASARPDIEGVALVGSHARNAAGEGSDVDLIILTKDVAKYFQNQSWTLQFGEVEGCKVESWGRVESLRTFYKDRMEVEYSFSPPDWAGAPVDAGTRKVVSDGMKIIYDPRGILRALKSR